MASRTGRLTIGALLGAGVGAAFGFVLSNMIWPGVGAALGIAVASIGDERRQD